MILIVDYSSDSEGQVMVEVKFKEKLFQCIYCDKFFRQGGQLRRYIRIYIGEKLFCCRICYKCFVDIGDLK